MPNDSWSLWTMQLIGTDRSRSDRPKFHGDAGRVDEVSNDEHGHAGEEGHRFGDVPIGGDFEVEQHRAAFQAALLGNPDAVEVGESLLDVRLAVLGGGSGRHLIERRLAAGPQTGVPGIAVDGSSRLEDRDDVGVIRWPKCTRSLP